MLVHRDLLRNHFTPVTRWYIKRFRKKQLAAAHRLQNKEVWEVAFMLTIPGMWKADYLFRFMQNNPRFHPYVVIYPYSEYKGFSREEIHKTLERTRQFVADKGFEYFIPYDSKRHRWLDIKKVKNPDIVIFSTPYRDCQPRYFIHHFSDRLTAYIHYGLNTLKLYRENYWHLTINLMGLYFLETPLHLDLAKRYMRNQAENAVVTGYPGIEVFLDKHYQPKDVWKRQDRPKKRVIWAPHHTIEKGFSMSTMLIYCDYMLELAERYADSIQFTFKPHQLLKFKLQQLWGEEKTDAYYQRWATMENTQLEESSYVDLFLTSDAMIHDCGSFTSEYLCTGKPVMYLLQREQLREVFTPFGEMAFDAHYHGRNRDDIEQFLSDVVLAGNDPKRAQREDFFQRYLQPIDGRMPSEHIIEEIERIIAQ